MDNKEFIRIIRSNNVFDSLIARLPELDLPDVWIASGALFQTVWNHHTGRDPEYGIKDYDIIYFDDDDLSWDAEDRVIENVSQLFADLDANIEVRNQARVPIWFQEKFGIPYPPISSAQNAITRFLATVCVIGVQPRKHSVEVYSPYGYVDVENMYIRPNLSATFQPHNYLNKAKRWKEYWPETVLEGGGNKAYLRYYRDDDT